jgi:competence ComEA-like helix-hairpin-helix protein
VERLSFSWTLRGFVTGVLLTAALLPGSQEKAEQAQEAKGKTLVERICVSCHEMDTVTGERRTRIGWEQSVGEMVSRGADGSEQEMAEVVAYLTKNFGKINVNTATAEQLQEFLGLTGKEAQAIAAYRDRNGPFKDFEQLKAAPDANAAKLQEKRSLIAFSL